MKVWIVLTEDRHASADAWPFSTLDRAGAAARAAIPEDVSEIELTARMREDGWVLFLTYGTEADCVRVIERTLDGG